MKTLASIITLSMIVGTAQSQHVAFETQPLGPTARVFDWDGTLIGDTTNRWGFGEGLNGTNFFAQLWSAPGVANSPEQLVPVNNFNNTMVNPLINMRNNVAAGYVQFFGTTSLGVTFGGGQLSTFVSVPGVVNGGPATVQLRVWYNANNTITSWAEALASSDPNMRHGQSPLLYLISTANPLDEPPDIPVRLDGLQGFTLVPEPSTLALAGLAATLFARRRWMK